MPYLTARPILYNLYKTNRHYAIMNKLLTNEKGIDKPGIACYTYIRKRKGEQNNVSNQNDNRKDD
jgi:hypothetical protein